MYLHVTFYVSTCAVHSAIPMLRCTLLPKYIIFNVTNNWISFSSCAILFNVMWNHWAFRTFHSYNFFFLFSFPPNQLMTFNNFCNWIFPISFTILKMRILTVNLTTRCHCEQFPCIAHGSFSIFILHFYDTLLLLRNYWRRQQTITG